MSSLSMIDDVRIKKIEKIVTPAELLIDIPLKDEIEKFIFESRDIVSNIINKKDPRLLTITGPCSIHNIQEALTIAKRIQKLQEKFPHLYILMRVYFEKPRSTVGWKGFINDPHLDNSCDINTGLREARKLLIEINKMGVGTAVEFLDTITPQYISHLVHWGAIGARTTESQEHRKLVSGLSMPVGFKNGTNGDIQIAIDAIGSAQGQHTFLSSTKDGHVAQVTTEGNPDGHIILRGGKVNGEDITNYDADSISKVVQALEKTSKKQKEVGGKGINTGVIVDFSHGNSFKKFINQPKVCQDIANQIAQGNKDIRGIMIESNLIAGAQKHIPGDSDYKVENIKPGQSITDECVSWETNVAMLEQLNEAAKKRGEM